MKIYTKTGDQGNTSLYGGKRVFKDDIRIESYGTVDELNAHLGHLITILPADNSETSLLIDIQNRLFDIGSNLASDPEKSLAVPDVTDSDIKKLEQAMDNMDQQLPPLRAFILPGGSVPNSVAHICRTVARRAERRVITLAKVSEVDQILIKYLNRLSDYFFVLSRYIAFLGNQEEIKWKGR